MPKFRADKLFDGKAMHDGDSVLVTADDGTIETILPLKDAGEEIQHVKGILSPGFINAHCHLELSHMKDMIPEGTGLVDFVYRVVTERQADGEMVLKAIEAAENEMYETGIVAVGDICNNALSLRQKIKGRLWYHNFIEASGFNPAIAEERFQRSVAFFTAYSKLYAVPVESNSITPHAPYSVADILWEKILQFPGNHLFSIHNQESEDEDEWFRTRQGGMQTLYDRMKMDTSYFKPTGKSSLQSYLSKFLRNQSVILVHNVHTSAEDIRFAMNSGLKLHWCLCPNANLYIGGRLPNIEEMIKQNCDIVLGTDSLASNHQLNMLSEIRTIRRHYPEIPLTTLLTWATSNGARALQIQSLMGSFEKKKKPGVIVIDEENYSARRLV